jgi:hypothetical protein
MKKTTLAFILSIASLTVAAECRITSVRDGQIATIFKKHGGWTFENYDEVCAKLNRARARIQIVGMASVLVNQSVGWASLTVVDMDSNVFTADYASMNTQVNSYASQDKADALVHTAINQAANDWTGLDRALAALEEERKNARMVFGRKK